MEDSNKENRKKKKRVAGSLAAGVTALSVLIGGLFSSPQEVLVKPGEEGPKNQPVIVEMQVEPFVEEETEEEEDDEKKKGLKAMIREWILGLPVLGRVLFVLPLWVLGYGLIAAVTALWAPFLSPVLSTIFRWLLLVGLLLLSFICVRKAISPDVPIKKILSKKNVVLVACIALVLLAADCILPHFIENYESWRHLFLFLSGLLFLSVIAIALLSRKRKKRQTVKA